MTASPIGLLDLIDGAASAAITVHFRPSGDRQTVADLWAGAARTAARLDDRFGVGSPLGVVLDSSPEALSVLLGAWRSGRRVVSLPPPPRASTFSWYAQFIEQACASAGTSVLLVPAEHLGMVPPSTLTVGAIEEVATGGAPSPTADRSGGELVQFTSGSTSDPRGVVLGMEQLAANVTAILEVLQPGPGDGSCSWLPLSHDMGLIGMTLSAICGCGPNHAGGGDVVLIRPDWFLRRPESWLQACSDHGSTITAAPDFGFGHAIKRADAAPVDLGRLRTCIVGAEPVRASTLRAFGEAFAGSGFREQAFCPAYGLAEAGLAVTMSRPHEPWRSIEVDRAALADGEVVLRPGGQELVSLGRPLEGYDVRTAAEAGAGQLGRVEIAGPSLFRGYLPGGRPAGEWFTTTDLGVVADGELFVVGRADDVVVLAGRNLYLADVDALVADACEVSNGRIQSVASPGGYAVVIERPAGSGIDLRQLQRSASRAALGLTGITPTSVVVAERGSLPRTSSGKPRRHELARRLASDELPIVAVDGEHEAR